MSRKRVPPATSRPPQRGAVAAGVAAPPPTRGGWLLMLGVLAATIFVYAPVRGYDFVSLDDPVYTIENPHLTDGWGWTAVAKTFTSSYANFWHPVTVLSLKADATMFGVRPAPFHVTNVLLHLGGVVVLFLALRRMTAAPGRSAFVAALFALHPLHVESVAWIAERKDVLSTLFLMLTLWAWAAYAQTGRRRAYGAALAAFALGLMAKPMLVTLPVVLLLLDVWPLGRVVIGPGGPADRWRAAFRASWPFLWEKIPFFALAAAAGAGAVFAQGSAVANLEAVPIGLRVANALVVCVTYIVKMVWPVGLTVFYPLPQTVSPWLVAASTAGLIGVSVAAIRLLPRHAWLAFGWFWYLVTLLPVSGLVQVGGHAMADRYTYVPLVGLFVVVAWGSSAIVGSGRAARQALVAAGVCVALACAVTARAQVETWRDSASLWQHALAVNPDNYYAHHGMGSLLREQGRTAEAIVQFDESIRLNPNYPEARSNFGMALEAQGRLQDAVAQYQEAIRLDPGMPAAHNNLGALLLRLGRSDEAAAHFADALRRSPDFAIAHDNLGQALAARGRFAEAVPEYLEALRLHPGFAAAHTHLGFALAKQNRPAEAVEHYRAALRLAAPTAETCNSLGVALAAQGQVEEAVAAFGDALRLDPRYVAAHVNLGFTLAGHGRAAEAIPHFAEAVRLQPDLEQPHLFLAWALGGIGRRAEAADEFRVVLRLNPNNEEARRGLVALAAGRANR